MHGHSASSAPMHPRQGSTRFNSMKERTVSATSENSQDKRTVPLLVEVVIWIQTVANVSSSAALWHCMSQVHSWTRTRCRARSLPLGCLFCSTLPLPPPAMPHALQATRSACSREFPQRQLSACHVLQPLLCDFCLCSQMSRCIRAVELGKCSQMLRCIRAVILGGRCASSSAFTLAAVDGVSFGMAATLLMLLSLPLSGTLPPA